CHSFTSMMSTSFIPIDQPASEFYTLSLHDALPISKACIGGRAGHCGTRRWRCAALSTWTARSRARKARSSATAATRSTSISCKRSEEHTSELQSHLNLVCRLLLEKQKQDE